MKLRYFLTSIIACLALAIGCTQEELPALSEIQVTPSYFTFGVDGGSKTVTVTAVDAWEVTDVPAWLNVSPAKGEATGAEGVKVTITAAPTTATKVQTASLKFNCAGKAQLVTVGQEAFVPEFPVFTEGEYWIFFDNQVANPVSESSTYGWLYTGKASVSEDGKLSSTADNIFTFKAVEGGFTIQDPTGRYYYMKGTYDSFNVDAALPETGGVWTVQQTGEKKFNITNISNSKVMQFDPAYSSAGAYSSEKANAIYPNIVSVAGGEIAEVTFAVEPTEVELKKEAGDFNINMTCKNEGFEIKPGASWIVLKGMTSTEGEYVVTFSYEENTGAARNATIDFISGEETITVEVTQEGSILDMTAAEINAAEDGAAIYRLTGYISGDTGSEYGNIYIKDATGEVYVYGVLDAEGNSKQWLTMGISVGDIVTVTGPKTSYNDAPQMKNVSIEKHVKVADKTVAEFLAAEESAEVYYRLTGTAEGIANAGEYGNFNIVDETGSVYVYGLLTGWGGEKKQFQTLGIKEGDKVTLVGVRASYNGTAQVGSAFYVSHEEGSSEEGGEDTPAEPTVATAAEINAAEDSEDVLYELTGYISSVKNDTYGNLNIKDATGEVYVYGTLDAEGAAKNFASLGISAGDIVTVTGPKTSYNGAPQMKNVTVKKHVKVADKTVAEFLAAEESAEVYFRLTGTAEGIANAGEYGNFNIVDETGSVYVYGLLTGWGGAKKQFQTLGINEGDKVTLVGVRTSYSGKAQVGSAFYVSHEAGSSDEGGEEGGDDNTGDEGGSSEAVWNMGSANQSWAADTHATYGAGYSATVDGITVAYYKHGNTNDARTPDSDHIRVYKGSALVVKAEGKKVKKVEITATANNYSYDIVVNGETVAKDGTTITWEGSTDSFEAVMEAGQVRIKTMKIVVE